MTKFCSKLSITVVLLSAATLHSQTAVPAGGSGSSADSKAETPDCLSGTVKDVKAALAAGRSPMVALRHWPVYICQFTADPIRAKLLTQAEQKRQDKQPGSASGSSGSTSLVSKGSSPWLLGFALEHGGLTQSTNGNTITFRGNVANSIRALLDGSYLGSYEVGKDDPLVMALAKVSFGISFDTSSSSMAMSQGFTPSGNNFSGFSTKYELYNHRDPRDKRYIGAWNELAGNEGVAIARTLLTLDQSLEQTDAVFDVWAEKALLPLPDNPSHDQALDALRAAAGSFPGTASAFPDWIKSVEDELSKKEDELRRLGGRPPSHAQVVEAVQGADKAAIPRTLAAWTKSVTANAKTLSASSSDAEILAVVKGAANSFHDAFWDLPKIKDGVASMTSRMSAFLDKEDKTVTDIRKSALITIEYNYTRQLTTSDQTVSATQPNQKLPSLSNINLVLEKGFQGVNAPEFTFNTGVTFFNTSSSGTAKWGRVRDYTASTELDVPLKEIQNVGRPTLSFAGQFLSLLEEPLGQQVMLNGVTISRKGNMGVFQTKLSIPVKDSGVKIPISLTYASRTELIKEKDVRGNIGITFDLDTLFSKAQ